MEASDELRRLVRQMARRLDDVEPLVARVRDELPGAWGGALAPATAYGQLWQHAARPCAEAARCDPGVAGHNGAVGPVTLVLCSPARLYSSLFPCSLSLLPGTP
jgi:hypothetical protein